MRIGEKHEGCRYWGYQIAAHSDAQSGGTSEHERQRRHEARKLATEQRMIIRRAGYISSEMGLTRKAAEEKARAIESRFPDIEMAIFNHDYL